MKGLISSAFILGFIFNSGFVFASSECEEIGVSIENTATVEQCMSACLATLKDACSGEKSYQRCENMCAQGRELPPSMVKDIKQNGN